MEEWGKVLLPIAFAFIGALLMIIYTTLNKNIKENEDEIKEIRKDFVTKEDFNRQNDKVDAKLDKILDILMGGRNEK